MNGTALYRALVSARAPTDEAEEASDVIYGKFDSIDERLGKLEMMVAEVRVTNRLNLGVSLVILLFILKLSFS